MSERQKTADWPIVAAVILCIALFGLGAYASMYYWRPRASYSTVVNSSVVKIREFRSKWEAALFQPAAKVETLLRGRSVQVHGPIIWTAT